MALTTWIHSYFDNVMPGCILHDIPVCRVWQVSMVSAHTRYIKIIKRKWGEKWLCTHEISSSSAILCKLDDIHATDVLRLLKFHSTHLASSHGKFYTKECFKNATLFAGEKIWTWIRGTECVLEVLAARRVWGYIVCSPKKIIFRD